MSNNFNNFQLPNNNNPNNENNEKNTFLTNGHSDSSHFNSSAMDNQSDIFNNDIINANPNNSNLSFSKETGIIEKMLVSYGFIQCCERQARLFFHFSQYLGNVEHLKVGDAVEYEMSYDRRTGKPIAISIRKITSDDLMDKLINTERVSGEIATEVSNNREGRVAFENLGEFFFIPYTREDIMENVFPKTGDKVTFIIVTDDSGNYRAKDLQIETSNSLKYNGQISSIKDTFGFIDRSDNLTNIFFHSSDCPNFKSLIVGDYVEFNVATRKGKELAINVVKIANNIEEMSNCVYKGQIVRYGGRPNFASGFISCPDLPNNKEIPFSDKDVKINFTLCANDFVSFQISTDRRSQTQRACNVQFLSELFNCNNTETRERGYVASLKETYGFIKCPSKEGSLIYFKLTELIDPNITLKLNDEVEFTHINDAQSKKSQAIRITILPNGTLFNIGPKSNNHKNSVQENNNYPLIDFSTDMSDVQQHTTPNKFRLNGQHGDNIWSPMEKAPYELAFRNLDLNNESFFINGHEKMYLNGDFCSKTGIIVAIKESYCFIESIDGENEYFGHESGYLEDDFEMGQTVEFSAAYLNGKWKATDIRKKQNLPRYEGELSDIYTGIVVRTIQMFNKDQPEYTGLIARTDQLHTLEIELDEATKINEKYEFSMTSFKFLKDYISVGDLVKFQVGTSVGVKKRRAFNVEVLRERIKGVICVISRTYGFVKTEIGNETRKIYFNKGEVSSSARLKMGDLVDFYLVDNKKTDKPYAIDIVKLEDGSSQQIQMNDYNADRPSMFKMNPKDKETGPKVIVIRQPKAPDGTKGFNDTRQEEMIENGN